MKRMREVWLAFGVLLVLAMAASSAAAQVRHTDEYRPGEVILKFRPEASSAARQAILDQLGATDVRPLASIGASRARISTLAVPEAVARYSGNAAIQFIEPNYQWHALGVPNDPQFSQLWGLQNTGQTGGTPGADISAASAWDITTGSSSVLIAIIDTGIDYTHPDLAANMFTNPGEVPNNGIDDDGNGYIDDVHGYDFVNHDGDPMDDHSHGTHVAGTIGAVGNNGVGVAGVNWNVKLLAVKFLSAGGSGSTDDAVLAIDYARIMGVRVMSNSWGGGGPSEALRLAIQAASDAGIVFVAAAGNSSSDNDLFPNYPSNYDVPSLVAVAATDHNDQLASFSSYGATTVDLAAPGVDVLSTVPGSGYARYSGTSMATPHVSGVFGLMFARFPSMSGVDAKALLLNHVDAKASLAGKVLTGGRLNAFLPIADPDTIPPDAVADLSVFSTNATRVTLHWTATGDDGHAGHPSRYDVRYSTSPITPGNFASALSAAGPAAPLPGGGAESVEIHGLAFATHYYFAVRAHDEWGNASPISNVADGTTLGAPDIGVTPTSLTSALLTGQTDTQTITVSNTGPGELIFNVKTSGLPANVTVRRSGNHGGLGGPGKRTDPSTPQPTRSSIAVDHGRTPARGPVGPSAIRLPETPQAVGLHLGILRSGGNTSEIENLLSSFPDIASIDVIDAQFSTPTPDQLEAFDAILVAGDYAFGDPNAIGDLLADAADQGKGVVVSVPTFINGWALGGRFVTGGYMPFGIGSGPIGVASLGTFNVSHPIMAGVTVATGDILGLVSLEPDAELVASWADGNPFVATRGNGVAAVNIFVGVAGFWTGDVPLILHNALFWSSQGASWLSTDVSKGVVPAGGHVDLAVTFDAVGLNGGDYDGRVLVDSDDPDEVEVSVAAHLHVTGAPDMTIEGETVAVESVQDYLVDGGRTTHTLPLSSSPRGGGSLELLAEGDYGDPSETATATAEGNPIGAVGRVGFDCTPASRTFALSAPLLAQLAADGHVDVEVQNSGDVNVFCVLNRHTVRLHYPLPADVMDFGTPFVGQEALRSLLIRNIGTDVLSVTGITSDNAAFVPLDAAFNLGPGDSRLLVVRFLAPAAGHFEGTLRLQSNDPDQPAAQAALRGDGLLPPDIAVTPTEFNENLFVGASVTRTLTIQNTGFSNLDWNISLESPPGPATVVTVPPPGPDPGEGSPRSGMGAPRSDQVPQGFLTLGSPPRHTQSATVLLIQDAAPWGTTSNEDVLQSNGIEFDRINSFALAGTNLAQYRVVIVPSDQPFNYYQQISAQSAKLDAFVSAGGILEFHAAAWGWNGGDASLVTLPGGTHIGFYSSYTNNVLLPAHPTMVGVPNPINGTAASHAYLTSLPGGAAVVTSDDIGRPTLATYSVGVGRVVVACQTMEYAYFYNQDSKIVLRNLIPYANGLRPPWLSIDPSEGQTPAGGQAQVTLSIDATGLLGGDYHMNVVVRSNDPDESTVVIPVNLHVTGASDIRVAPTAINFSPTFLGASRAESLTVSNVGTDLLHVDPLEIMPAAFTTDPGAFDLAPGGERGLIVLFHPTAAGPIDGTLTLRNNDPDAGIVVIPLHGEGVPPPDIAVSPTSISDALVTGQHATHQIHISNTGTTDLIFSILALDPAPGPSLSTSPSRTNGAAARGPAVGLGAEGSLATPPPDWSAMRARYDEFRDHRVAPPNRAESTRVPSIEPAPRVDVANHFTIFADDMEHGGNGWTHSSTMVGGSPDAWSQSTYRSSSGVTSWNVAQHAYSGSDALKSPLIDLARYTEATLGFHHLVNFDDCGGSPDFEPDGGIVEVSTDDGANWSQIYPTNGYPYVLDVTCSNPLELRPAYAHDGDSLAFQFSRAEFDLTPYVGSQIRLRFHAGWDCGNCDNNEGWYIDDVEVYSNGPAWLSASPQTGTVPPGGNQTVDVALDATGLYGGDYHANLTVFSNDPDEPQVPVAVSLHVTGAPDIDLSTTTIDFGTVYVGTGTPESLTVKNVGTDLLQVTHLTISPAIFSTNVTPFALAPGASRLLSVVFSPTDAGTKSGTLRIESNDVDEGVLTVSLGGIAIPPPVFTSSPDSLYADVAPGERVTQVITVRNQGGSDLQFDLTTSTANDTTGPAHHDGQAAPTATSRGGPDAFGYRWKDSDDPEGPVFDWQEIRFDGTPIFMAGNDFNYGPVPIGFPFPFYGNSFSNVNLCSNGWVSFTSSQTTPNNVALPSPSAPENLLAPYWDDLYFFFGVNAYVKGDASKFVIQFTDVYELTNGHYQTFEIVLYPDGRIVYQYYAINGPANTGTVGIQNGLRNIGLTVASNAVHARTNMAIEFNAGPAWLTVTPRQGTIPAGGTLPIQVTTDGTNLLGLYKGRIDLETNDPHRPSASVPVTMLVTHHPKLLPVPASLAFDSAFVGYPKVQTLKIKNTGSMALQVTGITPSRPQITVDRTSFMVPPMDSTTLQVTLSPTAAGSLNGELVIASNDRQSPTHVPVSGYGLVPPVAGVTPSLLQVSATPNQQKTAMLHVCNTGSSVLRYSIRAELPHTTGPAAVARSVETDAIAALEPGSDVIATPLEPAVVESRPVARVGSPESAPEFPALQGGGPDVFGHLWTDSDQPEGPTFAWIDVSAIGTRIPWANFDDDNNVGPLPIGFKFPFYSDSFTTFRACTNGWISFTSASTNAQNTTLPNSFFTIPENLVAPFWDDLIFSVGFRSSAYYHSDGNRLVVQFNDMLLSGQSRAPYSTFEIVLYRDGRIVFQYLRLATAHNGATVGIQNGARDDGLNIVTNAPYLHDNLAIDIEGPPRWIHLDQPVGSVPPHGCTDVPVRMDATGLALGDYLAKLRLTSNDPAHPAIITDAQLHVANPVPIDFDLLIKVLKVKEHQMHKRVEAVIAPAPPFTAEQIDVSSIRINGVVAIDPSRDPVIKNRHDHALDDDGDQGGLHGGHEGDAANGDVLASSPNGTELHVWFKRTDLALVLPIGDSVPVTVTGTMAGEEFVGVDSVDVRRGRVHHPEPNEVVAPSRLYTVTYDITETVQSVALLSSLDGGENWSVAVATHANTGSILWTVPMAATDSAMLAVVEVESSTTPGEMNEVVGVLGVSERFSIRSALPVEDSPTAISLAPVVPNPSNGTVRFGFALPARSTVSLIVFDIQGRAVKTLFSRTAEPGRHEVTWKGDTDSGTPAGSGLYFIRLEAAGRELTRPIVRLQ